MDSGQDLLNELNQKLVLLNKAIDSLIHNGRKLAKAEREYRVALAQQILKMRDIGMPVTIISDICRGDSDIADLKFARDVAQTDYDANMEAVNVWKLHVRVVEGQISREWNRRE